MSLRLFRDLSTNLVTGFTFLAATGDVTPDNIANQLIADVALNSTVVFSVFQLTGFDTEITASISNGEMQVSTDGITYGGYSSSAQPVNNNYWIRARILASSPLNSTDVVAVFTAGGVSAELTARTLPLIPDDVLAGRDLPVHLVHVTKWDESPTSMPAIPLDSEVDYGFDWSDWLPIDDTIVSSSWASTPNLPLVRPYASGNITSNFVSSAILNTKYVVTNTITTLQGRIVSRSIKLTSIVK